MIFCFRREDLVYYTRQNKSRPSQSTTTQENKPSANTSVAVNKTSIRNSADSAQEPQGPFRLKETFSILTPVRLSNFDFVQVTI